MRTPIDVFTAIADNAVATLVRRKLCWFKPEIVEAVSGFLCLILMYGQCTYKSRLILLDLYGNLPYNSLMKTAERQGRPTKGSVALTERVEMRMTKAEKQSFMEAAEIAGLDLSSWARMRLRQMAKKELTEAGRTVAFLEARKS